MIQKRVQIILMVVMLAFLLTACKNTGKPDNVSDSAYNAGLRAIQIADDYLDYKITREEAVRQIGEISDRHPYDMESYKGDTDVFLAVATIDTSLWVTSKKTEADILEARNKLAAEINQPRR